MVQIVVTASVAISGADCGCAAENNCAGIIRVFINNVEVENVINDDIESGPHGLACIGPGTAFDIEVHYEGTAGDIAGKTCIWETTVYPATP